MRRNDKVIDMDKEDTRAAGVLRVLVGILEHCVGQCDTYIENGTGPGSGDHQHGQKVAYEHVLRMIDNKVFDGVEVSVRINHLGHIEAVAFIGGSHGREVAVTRINPKRLGLVLSEVS